MCKAPLPPSFTRPFPNEFFFMERLPKFGIIVLGACVSSVLALWLFRGGEPAPRPVNKRSHSQNPAPSGVEIRETFASRMPSGKGVAVIASNGEYHGNHVLVAVPDAFRQIHYLPGTDPQAVGYLTKMHAAHQQMAPDYHPSNADLSAVPAGKSVSSNRKQIGVDAGKK
jgi:hypothetical protein